MFCINCGSELINGSNYCHACGDEVPNMTLQHKPKETIHDTIYTDKKKSTKNSTNLDGLKEATPIIERPKTNEFYSVSDWKFIALSVATFGLYELYWFGKNWTLVQKQENSKISPFWRSVFSIIFFNELAKKILITAKSKKYLYSYDPLILAILYFIISILWKLPGNWWLLSMFTFLPFLPLLKAIRYINETGNKPTSYTVSLGEVVVLIIGFVLWFLIVAGILIEWSDKMYYL